MAGWSTNGVAGQHRRRSDNPFGMVRRSPAARFCCTPSKAKAWAVGVNWYLARAIKVVVDYEHTTVTGGTAAGDREAENFVVTRVQHSF